MKKITNCLLCSLLVLSLTGCGSQKTEDDKEEKVETKQMVCTIDQDANGIKLNSTYEITYTGEYVDSVKTSETAVCKDKKTLKALNDSTKKAAEAYKDIEGYDFTINTEDTTLTSVATVDYKKVDIDKLIEMDASGSIKTLVKDGKIQKDGIVNMYKNLGATCEESK